MKVGMEHMEGYIIYQKKQESIYFFLLTHSKDVFIYKKGGLQNGSLFFDKNGSLIFHSG